MLEGPSLGIGELAETSVEDLLQPSAGVHGTGPPPQSGDRREHPTVGAAKEDFPQKQGIALRPGPELVQGWSRVTGLVQCFFTKSCVSYIHFIS